jgi:hypothetical protein
MVVIKSTQNGISEYLIARAIFNAMNNKNVLYVLPTDVIKARFVGGRFNQTVEYSNYYKQKIKELDSASMKSFGGIINLIGSNAPASFTEFVANDVIVDELDRCNQQNIQMATERQSSIKDKTIIKVSNPTILNFGIDKEWQKSDKKLWHIKCECGNNFHPDFFKHVLAKVNDNEYYILDKEWDSQSDRDIYLICDKCGKPVDRFSQGEWVKQRESKISGYHISKLFSTEVTLKEIVDKFNEGLTNDTVMQRFYNADLGLPFTSSGAKITEEMLDKCIEDYVLLDECSDPCIIGIDVGNECHIVISKPIENKLQVIWIGFVREEQEIIDILRRYNIIIGVIDAGPESRMARRLVASFKSMFMCFYNHSSKVDNVNPKTKIISTDRTSSLDGVKERVLLKTILLPKNARSIQGFYNQMTSSVRIFDEERQVYNWVETGADHYFHAMNYMQLAYKILCMVR